MAEDVKQRGRDCKGSADRGGKREQSHVLDARVGEHPLQVPLSNDERRAFLEDGDEICLRGYCEREGFVRIGLGTATGRILPGAPPMNPG